MKKYIVVAGNIGAGKSTLVDLLAKDLGWKPYYEPVGENPYLEDFYRDMGAWAYKSQLYFLADRLAMQKSLHEYSGSVVQDRSVYEDAHIFARNLFLQGHIEQRDFSTYWKLYELILGLLGTPDLIVYLKASLPTLKRRIAQRGRDFESSIDDEYLLRLNSLYEDWIGAWTGSRILTVDMDRCDLALNAADFFRVRDDIRSALRLGQGELF